MERLTKREGKHTVRIGNEWRRHDPVWDKLAAYEDIGLSPEDVKASINNSIYIVTLRDYDRDDIVGYFTSYEEAENCRKYLDMTDPSLYNIGWCIEEFGHDTTDYDSKYRTTLEELQCSLTERQEEIIRETELAELARLKAKYEGV